MGSPPYVTNGWTGAPPAATTTVQGIALQAPMSVNTTNPFAAQAAPAAPKPTAQAAPSPITTASLPAAPQSQAARKVQGAGTFGFLDTTMTTPELNASLE